MARYPESSCCGKPLPRGLKGQRKEAGAVLGRRHSQQRGAAQPGRCTQLPPNHSLAEELGETKPILSSPIPLLLSTPLVEPKWKPEAKGAQVVQAAEGSFPECGAERVKIERADPEGEVVFPKVWSTLHLHQNHFGSLFRKQLPGLQPKPTKSEYLWCPGIYILRKFSPGDCRNHLRISGKYGIMGILNLINS